MDETYSVYSGEKEVGNIYINKEGLYIYFKGQLRLKEHKIWRIILSSGKTKIDLGICVLENNGFILKKRIPTKNLPTGKWLFTAECPEAKKTERHFISEDKPFEMLDLIDRSKYCSDNDQPYILINSDH